MMAHRLVAVTLSCCSTLTLTGCGKQRFEKVPGETDIRATEVKIESADGSALHVEHEALFNRLGIRKGSAVFTDRFYNPFRQVEDRRRIRAHWQTAGFLDAEVDEPTLKLDEAQKTIAIRWAVHEGDRYELASIAVKAASPAFEAIVESKIPIRVGEHVDLEVMRIARYAMAEEIQRRGHGHARVYTRFFVDRSTKKIHAQYLVDEGPTTTVGSIHVDGCHHVAEAHVLQRTGLSTGAPFDLAIKEKAEFDLRDTGAFASATIESTADVEAYLGDVPDSGGVIDDTQIDSNGDLIPRKLSPTIDLVVHVREAPTVQLRARASLEADSTRIDAIGGAGIIVRNFIGSQHHLTIEGRIGHGSLWRGDTEQPTGLYGDALIRTTHPGLLGRLVDARLSGRYRDVLYPGFHLREITAGPGVRSTPARGVFLDLDTLFRAAQQVDFGSFDSATRSTFSLPDSDSYRGAEIDASVVWDTRNDPAEPMDGHLLALRTAWSPGGPLGTHRYLEVLPEARWILPASDRWSLALRASGGWVAFAGDNGVPLGPRLFGGGAFGMRGFGRDRLSPSAVACRDGRCRNELVGGLSLVQSTIELRFLPPVKQFGLATFVDVGGAGKAQNPFEDGVSVAFGLGPRLRLWYFPISLDAAYRFIDRGSASKPSTADTLLFFVRIGEAF